MNPIRRHLGAVALLALLAMPTAGCGLTFAQDIAIANGAVSVVQMLVTAIKGWEQTYYSQRPSADQQAKVEQLIAETLAADALVSQAIQTTGDIKSDQVTAAFADLYADYEDLMSLLKDIGVVTVPATSSMTAEGLNGRLYVLPADALIPAGVDAAKVQVRAKAVRAARARASEMACHGVPALGADGKISACRADDLSVCVPLSSCPGLSLRSPGDDVPPPPPIPIADQVGSASGGLAGPPSLAEMGSPSESRALGAAPGEVGLPGDSGLTEDVATVATESIAFRQSLEFNENIPAPVLFVAVSGQPSECGPGMRSVTPMAPGAVCLREGESWSRALAMVRKQCAAFGGCSEDYGSPLADAIIEMAHAKTRTVASR